MSFNQYLSEDKLLESFSDEEWDSLNHLLETFLPKEKTRYHVTRNRKLLGEIHHSINLDKYQSKKFRKELFETTPALEKERYFKYCGIYKKISTMDFNEKMKHIDNVIGFKWGDNEKTRKFLSFCNFSDYLIPDESVKIEKQEIIFGGKEDPETGLKIVGKNDSEEKFEPLSMLHGYQASVVHRILKRLETPNRRCLIQMPTGTGKTKVAMEILAHILNNNPEIRVIWLANKHELLDQAHDAFIQIWNHVGKTPINLINLWIKGDTPKIPESNVVIFSTYGILNNLLDEEVNFDSNYVFVDEAHQILAPTYNAAINDISRNPEKETRLVGLTATPGRGISEEQNIRFTHEFNREIIKIKFDEEDEKIYKGMPLQYLEDNEILAKTIPSPLNTKFELEISSEEWKELSKLSIETGDYAEFDEKGFKKMANDNVRNILIIRKLKELLENGVKKILYFSTNKNQSLIIFTVLQQMGIKAIHVGSNTGRGFRRQVIKKFKDTDEIEIICNYDIFTTGFDVPKLEVVFVARPVNSPVLFNQIVGRGTRGLKMNGTSKNILVQVIDKTQSKFIGFSPYRQYKFWDDNWKEKND